MTAHVVAILNDLIEISKDGEEGFRKAAEEVSNAELKRIFGLHAEDCARAAHALQQQVQRLGGKPESTGSFSGALHRGWMSLKTAVIGHDEHTILSECERGEDVAKKHYREALEKDLPANIRALIEAQFQGVLKNHEQIHALRDQYAAAARASK